MLGPGDLVVLVGTQGAPTLEQERGRILGMMEPTKEAVFCMDFDLPTSSQDFTEDKKYKWPFGLLNKKAWRFLDRPLLKDITSRSFHMDAASGIVALTNEEAFKVLNLARVEIPLLETVRTISRIEGEEEARRRGAPPPTTKRNGVMHLRKAPAYTYAMRIEGASPSAFKIGWAFDHKVRQRQFNLYAMSQIGGLHYQTCFAELWPTARLAFNMEQRLLLLFDHVRHNNNREVIYGVSYEDVQSAWINCIQKMKFHMKG